MTKQSVEARLLSGIYLFVFDSFSKNWGCFKNAFNSINLRLTFFLWNATKTTRFAVPMTSKGACVPANCTEIRKVICCLFHRYWNKTSNKLAPSLEPKSCSSYSAFIFADELGIRKTSLTCFCAVDLKLICLSNPFSLRRTESERNPHVSGSKRYSIGYCLKYTVNAERVRRFPTMLCKAGVVFTEAKQLRIVRKRYVFVQLLVRARNMFHNNKYTLPKRLTTNQTIWDNNCTSSM